MMRSCAYTTLDELELVEYSWLFAALTEMCLEQIHPEETRR